MAVSPEVLAAVRTLLKRCTASVTLDDGSHGSGFFIDERRLLTCAHVAGAEGGTVSVHPVGRDAPRPGTVVTALPGNDLDLAIVEVDPVPGEPPQPAVVLDRAVVDNIDYYAVGYPAEVLVGEVGLEEVSYPVNTRLDPADGVTPRLLMIQAGGPLVVPGISGGALLSSDSGAVVGLVQYSRDVGGDKGGAGIPIVRAAEHLPLVHDLLASPPLATRAWRDALGRAAWRQLGNQWEWRTRLDILVSGDVKEWHIRADSEDGDAYTVSGQGLPSRIAEALFHWAKRRRVRDPEDVELLGRLLAGALLPDPLVERLIGAADSDELMVRLRFDDGGDLFDVPWEFVTLRVNGETRQVATSREMRLARVAPRADGSAVDVLPAAGTAGVLGIVVQPEDWQRRMPNLRQLAKDVAWPEQGALAARLGAAIESGGTLSAHLLDTPLPSQVPRTIKELERGAPLDVVHYCGFGQLQDGVPRIAFSDDEGDAELHELDNLFAWVSASPARVLVVQFLLPPSGTDPDPIPPSAFRSALRGRVNAVVFTPVPVHPRQAQAFNRRFYEALGGGATIEAAVQEGRAEVGDDRFLGDAAGFAWFSLITGPQAGLQVVEAGSTGSGSSRGSTLTQAQGQ